jgi:prophage antirepressor-like protein
MTVFDQLRALTEAQRDQMLNGTTPAVKRFQRWLYHEVLPCIDMHGAYPAPDAVLDAGRAILTPRDHSKIIDEALAEVTTAARAAERRQT